MIVNKMYIEKFRGFNNQELRFGDLNIIVGENGTQKTTLMGLITHPFTNKDSYFNDDISLLGRKYKYNVSDIIQLSPKKDIAGEHKWKIYSEIFEDNVYPISSIYRDKNKGTIRFWNEKSRERGSGYAHVPVLYLSLGRLSPIVESKIGESKLDRYNESEIEKIEGEYAKIFAMHTNNLKSCGYSKGDTKQISFADESTDFYSSSSGQDNITQILQAVFSFEKLKEKYPNDYSGGLLIIDEIESTLHPFSQRQLIEFLRKKSKKINIQIIVTTHSNIIFEMYYQKYQRDEKVKLIQLSKKNNQIIIDDNPQYPVVHYQMQGESINNVNNEKYIIIREDLETELVFKTIAKKYIYIGKLKFEKYNIGCTNLIQFTQKTKIPYFINTVKIIDADVENKTLPVREQIKNKYIKLPGSKNPENTLYDFLLSLDDDDILWDPSCFTKNYILNINAEQMGNRDNAKKWFNDNYSSHRKKWVEAINRCYAEQYEDQIKLMCKSFIEITDPVLSKNNL